MEENKEDKKDTNTSEVEIWMNNNLSSIFNEIGYEEKDKKNRATITPKAKTNKLLNFFKCFFNDLLKLNQQRNKSQRKWALIAEEVYLRKTLLLAAKHDLNNQGMTNSSEKAAADVFVEKAQRILTSRGRMLSSLAGICIFFIIVGLSFFVYHLAAYEGLFIANSQINEIDSFNFALRLLRNITVATAVLAGAYILFSLARAFLHEAQVTYNKRHALRFGRLYVYLKKGDIVFKELEEAFKWNSDFTSAFKDINTEVITKTLYKSLIDVIPQVVNATINKTKRNMNKRKLRRRFI